jgi:hypothetical protein
MSTSTPKPAAKRLKTAPTASTEAVSEYRMPKEVADWIRHAESRITYLTGRVDELKADNAKLKKANKVMEARVMGQSQE